MQYKKIHELDGQRTYVAVFDTGDEVMLGLEDLARTEHLSASQFTAIGAFSDAVICWFDYDRLHYKKIPVTDQVEVLNLSGDVALKDGQPMVHAHVVLGRSDGSTRGGHLHKAHVRPTLEVVLTESPEHLRRTVHDESGLALIDLRGQTLIGHKSGMAVA